jgi:2-methylisocitrate lyase-like PEP mutase family enzyme
VASNREDRAARFKALHEGAPFVIPNPWDAGSARVLKSLGFQALATTSSGFAFTLGRVDGSDVGGSIEDWDRDGHLYELPHAAERVAAAVEAVSGFGWPYTLTARAENHIRGNPDLDDTIERLQAFEAAGADVLYAPGLGSAEEIRQVCAAVSKPVNVLARPGLNLHEIFEAGAQRVSVGGSLTWAAVQAFVDAATTIRDDGSFELLGDGSRVGDWLG